MLRIYVDADACPVKEDIYKVAKRYQLPVFLVAAKPMRHPNEKWLSLVVVGEGFDEADDHIVDSVSWGDIVVTTDIPLAARCLEKGAKVLGHRGRFEVETPDARVVVVGVALATASTRLALTASVKV